MTNSATSAGPGNVNPKGQIPKAAAAKETAKAESTKLSREDTKTAILEAMKYMDRADGHAIAREKLQEILDKLQ